MAEEVENQRSSVWSKRLALGLPVVVVLLAVIAANMTGTVLLSRDLRGDYASLVDSARIAGPATPVADEQATTGESAGGPPAERPQVDVELSVGEFWIEADVDDVPAWAEVTFHVVNDGEIPHDAAVGEVGTAMLEVGETDSFTVEADGSGVVEIHCTVPGHEAGGMVLELPITGSEATPPAAGDEDAATPASAAASPDNADEYDGDRPELVRRDPGAPATPEGDVVEVTLEVTEEVVQVAPDVWQEVWTFGGQVPGPVIRAEVGDTVRVTVQVPADAQVPHSMDFHSSQTAWNRQMVDIAPGDELVYEFEATHAGISCTTAARPRRCTTSATACTGR